MLARSFRSAHSGRSVRCGIAVTARQAHAARLPSEDDDVDHSQEAGPSRVSASTQHRVRSLKGKERETEIPYCFPQRSRRGGPPDPYEVLALERSASEGEIKRQYYKLAMILHPDSSHPAASPDHFATLNRAYNLLSQSQSRSAYLQSGYGWSASGEAVRESWSDAQMRSEIFARRRGGAAAWEAGRRGYRDSEAGRGAWQYPNQEQWQYGSEFATPPQGNGEELYMSNRRFMSLFGAATLLIAWIQYHRVGMAADTHRELLQAQHQGASQALAEAREDAVRYGKERRERIRRRVREMEVMSEVEKLKSGDQDSPSLE